ncbi:uncharacterized protein LOC123875286 [Maniola jurtina]|uniref:uncharacterized protein LOC123866767 n=1 Tax=Maniola jurtina TaxID=191418 RepID=UPI001E689F45|nr:uncharacterized protein LOC123866767 [Maniola jurtina]XP_045776990.1 uncharacterized protein LOC123875286 [Maniola jurtina]
MEDIVQLLKKIQEDINETKDSIKISEINLLNKIDEKFDDIQSKLQNLEVTVSSQEQRLDLLEKQARERNIVIFGVEEKEQNYEDLHNNILKIFSDIMKIDCTSFEIQEKERSENTKRGNKRNLSETPPDKHGKNTRKPKKTTQPHKNNNLTSYWTNKDIPNA